MLVTRRLMLRPFTIADLDAIAAIWGDPVVARYLGDGQGRSRFESEQHLHRTIAHQARYGFSLWAAVHRQTGSLIGRCGLQYLSGTSEIELGYAFARSVWGQGYATESVIAAIQYGFTALELDHIVAIVHPDNQASKRVLEKVGMVDETNAIVYAGMRRYGIGRDRWQPWIDRPLR